jgi:CrcB protein
MLLVGLAGSLTTMSALSIESVEMLSGGNYSEALLNILLNLGLSLLAASLGVTLAKYGFNLAQS